MRCVGSCASTTSSAEQPASPQWGPPTCATRCFKASPGSNDTLQLPYHDSLVSSLHQPSHWGVSNCTWLGEQRRGVVSLGLLGSLDKRYNAAFWHTRPLCGQGVLSRTGQHYLRAQAVVARLCFLQGWSRGSTRSCPVTHMLHLGGRAQVILKPTCASCWAACLLCQLQMFQ